MFMRLFFCSLGAVGAAAAANATWRLISKDIGGGPLGVSCFEDGLTCVTATSQILPAGYEVKRSQDGGVSWATVPDADLFIFGLDNQAVFGSLAIVSGDEFIQCSVNKGANFTQVPGSLALAGGEIARKLRAADGSWSGFAILGMTVRFAGGRANRAPGHVDFYQTSPQTPHTAGRRQHKRAHLGGGLVPWGLEGGEHPGAGPR
jgi:hypothetical protein